GGAKLDDLVTPVDLYATILDLAEVPIPGGCQGRSLRARLAGEAGAPRATLYGAIYPLQSTQERADAGRDAQALWARDARWKYILCLKDVDAHADAGSDPGEREDVKVSLAPDFHRKRGDVELYDLTADPHELVNVAARPENAAQLGRFKGELLAW